MSLKDIFSSPRLNLPKHYLMERLAPGYLEARGGLSLVYGIRQQEYSATVSVDSVGVNKKLPHSTSASAAQCTNRFIFKIFLQSAQYKSPNFKKGGPAVSARIDSVGKSLASKGFLRPTKAYAVPDDAAKKITEICTSLNVSTKPEYKLVNLEEKFKFLEACFNSFKHSVPNSQVHEINTVGDIIEFYKTPVDTTVPFDAFKEADLPPNLHIQYEYVRFNPQTDTRFSGQTAFPKSSTLVTGLKYREKYPGHIAKRSFP